ncbi:MAG: PTS N-acetylgalactosamine transporter subunit IID [Streptococcaceae bacterium]|nr:PTS N-acetylgalactosamine transporter subunit IID [Streptococcaceae bacterium]
MVSNKKTTKILTKRDITMLGIRSLFNQSAFNYQRMQADGYTIAILPALRKVYGNDKEGLAKAMCANLAFFNTNNYAVSFIEGLSVALEENHEKRDVIDNIRISLFGPLAGIGDAITWFTILPIIAGITASFAKQGNILGPLIFFLAYIGMFLIRIPIAHLGYTTGTKAIKQINENMGPVSHAANVLGITVIGGLIASYVQIKVLAGITVAKGHSLSIQTQFFDHIFPNILPLGYVFFLYWLLKKKNASPLLLIGITFALSIILSYLKVL